MITSIVFSKNRACQLELLLRSLSVPVTVLYTFDSEYKDGYEKVMSIYPSVQFIKQIDFRRQLIELIGNSKYCMFFVDDDVMINSFNEYCPEFEEFMNDSNILSLSLYLCRQYKHRGLPVLDGNKWEWKPFSKGLSGNALRIWGHPMTVGSTIFRTDDILPIIKNNKMSTPNYLEAALDLNIPKRDLMMCFDKPKVIVNAINQVQTDFKSHTRGPTAIELERIFLEGKRLSLDDIKEKASSARTHRIAVDYAYERYE